MLYSDSLRPPPGYVFDAAVAATFSLDFETALAAPVSLALFGAEDRDELLAHPLALLEGVERIAGRLAVFADVGRIHAQHQPHSRLCALLERMIVEVAAPGGGAFHPKFWALRFKRVSTREPVRLRLLVLSRNLTRDRSWDLALTLDGVMGESRHPANRPLGDLIRRLPGLGVRPVAQDIRTLAQEMAEDVERAEWTLPEPFAGVSFAVNGLGAKLWQPPVCHRLGVISPFVDDSALELLAGRSEQSARLIGRSDELAAVSPEVLCHFAETAVLDDVAASKDGEEAPAAMLEGLHAKAYVSEFAGTTAITVGSGNATRPALITGRNVEVFATLTGKRSRVGSVDDILGPEGFGRLTRPFVDGEVSAPDPQIRAAEARVDAARRALCTASLVLRCEPAAPDSSGEALWWVRLVPPGPVTLSELGTVTAWLITRGESHGREALNPLRQGEAVDLGTMPLVDLTRFIAFRISDATGQASALFSTGLSMEGLPADRDAAILRWVIDSKESFLRYLRLLLAELGEPFAAALVAHRGEGAGTWRTSTDDAPLLEQMVRALCRGGDELRAIERLMARLDSQSGGGADPIPAEFRQLWDSFREALDNGETRHAG